MSSRHLVDPELLPIIDNTPDVNPSAETLESVRAGIAELTRLSLEEADQSVRVSEHYAPGSDGSPNVRLVLYKPDGLPDNAPVVLQIHGGGFLFGTAELGDPRNRAMSKAVGCAVCAVDYRIAPEHAYPAALNDCYAALVWLEKNASVLGIDARRIAIRGESAGGGLAAATAILARDRKGPEVVHLTLVYPMLDDRTCVAPANPTTGEFIWRRDANYFAWQSWLGMKPGEANVPELAAPARCGDLSGLPPTFIGTAAMDLFVDENLQFAARLMRAGVPVELYVAPGAFHGFDALGPQADVSARFIAMCDQAFIRAFETSAER